MKQKKKRINKPDSTLRHVRAANRRIKRLELRVSALELTESLKSGDWAPNICNPLIIKGREKKRKGGRSE